MSGLHWVCLCFFFFKQKTAYELRISDWSSDVCSSDLSNGGSGGNSAQGGTNSGSTGIEGALNSFGGANGGRSDNSNGNGNRRSNGGPAENGNSGGGRDSAGGSARNLPAQGNSAGSGTDRLVDRIQKEKPANNSGETTPQHQQATTIH